jgi:hypothetical protein
VHESLDRVAVIVRDDRQRTQGLGLKSVDGALPRFPVLSLVGGFGEPLPRLAVDIVQIDELPEGPEVLARIPYEYRDHLTSTTIYYILIWIGIFARPRIRSSPRGPLLGALHLR